jgi:KipI family sensor histidine kinase inhibitor
LDFGLTRDESVRFFDVAEGAVLVEYPGLAEEDANRKAVAAARRLAAREPAGLLDSVPGARTLLVEFDPRRLSRGRLAEILREGGERKDEPSGAGRLLRIPVFYDPDPSVGPDLEEVARKSWLAPEEFARRHASENYRVAFLGFAPGFAYLTGLSEKLHSARLATPRTRVPAGSVGIGASYTGIYPGETPGGWRLIGRAPVRLFDPAQDPPSLLLPGDAVKFEAIRREEFDRSIAFLEPARGGDSPPDSGSPLFWITAPGVLTNVAGPPRRGWSGFGVPPGGAMDFESLAAGNAAVGNPPFAAALEMTLVGPDLEVLAGASIALAGAGFNASLNGRPVVSERVLEVRPRDVLKIGKLSGSARGYLCVAGGLAQSGRPRSPKRLAAGDMVFVNAGGASAEIAAPPAPRASVPEARIRVLPGPQQERFAPAGLATFLGSVYRVSASSDRRGIRLEGPAIENRESPDIPPEGTTVGGIQVPRDGQPIVLGPDRPITGGYARIATVVAADFPILARALPGTSLRFRQVTLEEALAASTPESRIPRPGGQE